MRFIDPDDIQDFPIAAGWGVHGDEADSAIGDIETKLTPGAAEDLIELAVTPEIERAAERDIEQEIILPADVRQQNISLTDVIAEIEGQDRVDVEAIRQNPSDDDDEEPGMLGLGELDDDGKKDVTIRRAELYPVAKLITGMWGPDHADLRREIDESGLPIEALRRNPSGERRYPEGAEPDRRSMHDRLLSCRVLLAAIRRLANKRYDSEQVKRGSKWISQPRPKDRRPWSDALATCGKAVEYVLEQFEASSPSIFPHGRVSEKPFDLRWGILAAKGNKKLPFVAYSEFPMVTCSGAGACAVYPKKTGYCYSFKALRYPGAFQRLFLNTLANYADREFAIIRSRRKPGQNDYKARVEAALVGTDYRQWPAFILAEAAKKTQSKRREKVCFLRLFVDGDLNTEDNIIEWMNAIREFGEGGRGLRSNEYRLEVYGYTKCWQQMVNVDNVMRAPNKRSRDSFGGWPRNYTVNLSVDSIYQSGALNASIRARMESLPVSRGYFTSIPLKKAIKTLDVAYERVDGKVRLKVPTIPSPDQTPFEFDERRIRDFAALNIATTEADVAAIVPGFKFKPKKPETRKGHRVEPPPFAEQLRSQGYHALLSHLMNTTAFGKIVKSQIAKDMEFDSLRAYVAAFQKKRQAGIDAAMRIRSTRQREAAIKRIESRQMFSEKVLQDKALAIILHETIWAYSEGTGGSCPLVCGSCDSSLNPKVPGVHRCADKEGAFKDAVIHIGLH